MVRYLYFFQVKLCLNYLFFVKEVISDGLDNKIRILVVKILSNTAVSLHHQPDQMENFIPVVDNEMKNLTSIEGVHGVILYRIDGLVIHSVFSCELSQELLNLAISFLKDTVKKVSQELSKEITKLTYARAPYTIPFYKIGHTAILAGITDNTANSGLLEIEFDRASQSLAACIEG